MRLRGVVTRPDGGVDIIIPAVECVETLRDGGGIGTWFLWRRGLRSWLSGGVLVRDLATYAIAGEIPISVALEWEAEKFVRDALWRPDRSAAERRRLAERWVNALHTGGLSEIKAVRLIVEKDMTAWGLAPEIVDVDDIPNDRRHRNAWRRSRNGGPIWIDDDKAREIDEHQMWRAYDGTRAA